MIRSILGNRAFGLPFGAKSEPEVDGAAYAVGDLHGHYVLLEALMDRMLPDILRTGDRIGRSPELIFVGDMIDRGQESRGVVEFLCSVTEWPEVTPIFLVGNHELMLLQFLNDPVGARRWLRYGGYDTLRSYGLEGTYDLGDSQQLHDIAAWFRDVLGAHLTFFEELRASHMNGNVLFTHAGADPAVAPSEQDIKALVWGVPDFHRTRRQDGVWVVHGHTVVEEPSARAGRIAIDTGAYQTGRLSAVRMVGSDVSFLTQEGAPCATAALDDHF